MRTLTARIAAFVLALMLLVPGSVARSTAAVQTEHANRNYLPLILVYGPRIYHYALPLAYGIPHNCEVIAQSPADGSYVLAGVSVNVSWTLRNTSYDTWKAGTAAVRYLSEVKPDANETVFPLPYDVSPQHMLQITIPFTAPTIAGTYRSNWDLSVEHKAICQFFVEFRVP